MEVTNGERVYEIFEAVAETDTYRLIACTEKKTSRQCLLQIATDAVYNKQLERSVYILNELRRLAKEIEEEYQQVKEDPKDMLNYGLMFPEVIDSFIYQQQGKRKINILAFRNVDDLYSPKPLSKITEKDRRRVDLFSSVWIMGKLLKLLVFTHSQWISINLISGNNILIVPDKHYVSVLDWSEAKIQDEAISFETRVQEISLAAKAVITVLGGDPDSGIIPDDGEPGQAQYASFLWRLARGGESVALRAHEKFYELVRSLWERKFHPFTTKPLDLKEEN